MLFQILEGGLSMDVILLVVISVVQIIPFSVASIELDRADLPKISTKFQGVRELDIGTPVFSKGQLVGRVAAVKPIVQVRKQWGDYEVDLALTEQARNSVADNTVALISSPLVSPKKQPKTIIELVSSSQQKSDKKGAPQDSAEKNDSKRIKGFSSYEQYWRADS